MITTATTNPNSKLRQIANIYDLPILLQVPGYRLQVTSHEQSYLVKLISFQKGEMVLGCDSKSSMTYSPQTFASFLGNDYHAILGVEDDPSTLVFECTHKSGSKYTWYFRLVPDTKSHPNIVQALKQGRGEE